MDLKKTFGVDKDSAENGKWFDLREDGRVKVARLNNTRFKAEVARLQKPHISKLRLTGVDNEALLTDITIKATAKTILVDWEGISIDGEEIPYSPEKAYELLSEFNDFLETVSSFSIDRTNYSLEDIAEK